MKEDLKALLSLVAIVSIFAVILTIVSQIEDQKLIRFTGNAVVINPYKAVQKKPSVSLLSDHKFTPMRKLWQGPQKQNQIACTDKDGGADFMKFGYTVSSAGQYLYDYCSDRDILHEAVCSSRYGSGKFIMHSCSEELAICLEGKCVVK